MARERYKQSNQEGETLGDLVTPRFLAEADGSVRLLPVEDYPSVLELLRARIDLAAEYRRRLEIGEQRPLLDLTKEIKGTQRDEANTAALVRMTDPATVLTAPQRQAVLHMLDQVCLPPHERWIDYLALATIANYMHGCEALRAAQDGFSTPVRPST